MPRESAIGLTAIPVVLSLMAAASSATAQTQQDREVIRRGQLRADLSLYQQQNDPDGSYRYKADLRLQRPWFLPEDWKLTWRIDVPLLYTNAIGHANPDGDYDVGLGDMYGQLAVTTPAILPGLDVNAGLRLTAPTGGKSPFGASQWTVAVHFGIGYDVPLSPGFVLELAPTLRIFHGFGTTRAGIMTTRKHDAYPTIAFHLPDDWTILFWDENPATYNARDNAWFVPFDVMVTKKITANFQVGAGAAVKLVDNYPQYKYMLYGRASAFF